MAIDMTRRHKEGWARAKTMLAEQINYLRRLIRAVRRLGLDYGNEQHFLQVVHELEKRFPAR